MTSIPFPFAKHKPTISHISRCGCPVKAATAEAQALFPIEAPGTETVIEGWDDPLWGDRQRARARIGGFPRAMLRSGCELELRQHSSYSC